MRCFCIFTQAEADLYFYLDNICFIISSHITLVFYFNSVNVRFLFLPKTGIFISPIQRRFLFLYRQWPKLIRHESSTVSELRTDYNCFLISPQILVVFFNFVEWLLKSNIASCDNQSSIDNCLIISKLCHLVQVW